MKYEQVLKLKDIQFRRSTGVKRTTFNKMLEILEYAYQEKKSSGGRPSKLKVIEMLLMTLEYLGEYRTYFQIGVNYGVSESSAYKHIIWVENILINSKEFRLPGKRALYGSDIEITLIDVTESPIQRPKKKQSKYYSGKKKRHTIKTQVVVDKSNGSIICTNFANGRKHDFKVFKESKVKVNSNSKIVVDSGYQGLQKIHTNIMLPKKHTKKRHLTKEDKKHNHLLASTRVLNENVIGLVKRFKIIADKYRNRRKRFGLRFNLIAGLHNFELN